MSFPILKSDIIIPFRFFHTSVLNSFSIFSFSSPPFSFLSFSLSPFRFRFVPALRRNSPGDRDANADGGEASGLCRGGNLSRLNRFNAVMLLFSFFALKTRICRAGSGERERQRQKSVLNIGAWKRIGTEAITSTAFIGFYNPFV